MKQYYYLVHIQYLGFRYHGWLKQPGLKTVSAMIEKTARHILNPNRFKILGTSRTDAKVSSSHSAFELFVDKPLNCDQLLLDFNRNLPGDIRVTDIEAVDRKFNIINSVKIKEYLYLFSIGEKAHPFSAPLMSSFQDNLDIDVMKKGAMLFQGHHNFKSYCTKPKPGTIFKREVVVSKIEENNLFKANFFPLKSFAYHIHSKGFMRNQVRLIMGQLLSLGRGELALADIKESLKGQGSRPLRHIAPASGLILNSIEFDLSS